MSENDAKYIGLLVHAGDVISEIAGYLKVLETEVERQKKENDYYVRILQKYAKHDNWRAALIGVNLSSSFKDRYACQGNGWDAAENALKENDQSENETEG